MSNGTTEGLKQWEKSEQVDEPNTGKELISPPRTVDPPKCRAILEAGITKSSEMKSALSALMSDLASDRITAGTGNSICNAAGKILKTVELEQKYGVKGAEGPGKTLALNDVAAG